MRLEIQPLFFYMSDNNILKPVLSADNSYTLHSSLFDEHYHSINGAINESQHIFINLGLKKFINTKINILEIGYGTALNAILSYVENNNLNNIIYYHGIELYPLEKKYYYDLNFDKIFNLTDYEISCFYDNYQYNSFVNNNFTLYKEIIDFNDFCPKLSYDLIFFDAFSPNCQEEMWSKDNLAKIVNKLTSNGIFVTYCSKGIVKQRLRDLGLNVVRHNGPPGKRHVISAQIIDL